MTDSENIAPELMERLGDRARLSPMRAVYNMENDELVGFTAKPDAIMGADSVFVSDAALYTLPVKQGHYADLVKYRRALEGIPSCRP